MAEQQMKKGYVKKEGPETPEMQSAMKQMRRQQANKVEENKPEEKVAEVVPPEVPTEVEMPDELSVLVGKAGVGENEWTDCKGVTHPVIALDFTDLSDFTKRHGEFRDAFTATGEGSQIELMITIIWLSVRKEDLTDKELDAEEWKYSRKATGRMFRLNDGVAIAQLGMALMKLSGLDVEEKGDEGNVEEAGAED